MVLTRICVGCHSHIRVTGFPRTSKLDVGTQFHASLFITNFFLGTGEKQIFHIMKHKLCPTCSADLKLTKCLSETEAIMQCSRCGKNYHIIENEKIFPKNLNSFNWGAFLLGPWWCFGNKQAGLGVIMICLNGISGIFLILGILAVIAYFVLSIILGIKGNKMAWRDKDWKSTEHFERVQRNWTIAGICVTVIPIILCIIALLLM